MLLPFNLCAFAGQWLRCSGCSKQGPKLNFGTPRSQGPWNALCWPTLLHPLQFTYRAYRIRPQRQHSTSSSSTYTPSILLVSQTPSTPKLCPGQPIPGDFAGAPCRWITDSLTDRKQQGQALWAVDHQPWSPTGLCDLCSTLLPLNQQLHL